MKKVIATMFAMALLALTVTNASADPASSARAYAYGVDVGGSLLGDIIDQEPNVESVLPPGGDFEEDIVTADLQPLALEGVGIVQAQTRVDSTISDEIVLRPEGFRSGDGGAAPGAGGLLGDLLGGGEGGLLGSLLGGTGGVTGFQTQQLGGGGGEGGGLLGNLIGEGLLGDLGGGAEGDPEDVDENILIPSANARSFASIDLTGVATEDDGAGGGESLLGSLLGGTGGVTGATDSFQAQQLGGTETLLTRIVFDALLRLGVIEAEAVVTCAGGQPFFDLASRIVESQGSDLDIGETLNDLLTSVFQTVGDLAPELIDIKVGEQGITPDGTGFFVNALHITVGQEILDQLPETPVPTTTTIAGVGTQNFQTQQVGGDEPLIDIVLGHAEVSGTVCAELAPPPTLEPTGPGPILPRTGGLGILPAVLGVGLLGGAVAAGRFALRARGNGDSL